MSLVYSILKCEFGWNGVLPDSMGWAAVESIAGGQFCASERADRIAVLLAENGAVFRERIDGQPNRRRVVGGVVVRAAGK